MVLYFVFVVGFLAAVSSVSADAERDLLFTESQHLMDLIDLIEGRIQAVADAKTNAATAGIFTCWKMQMSNFQDEANNAYKPLQDLNQELTSLDNDVKTMADDKVEQLAIRLYDEDDGLLQKGYELIGNFSQVSHKIHHAILSLNTTSCD